jgi:hypothetical protein
MFSLESIALAFVTGTLRSVVAAAAAAAAVALGEELHTSRL